MGPTRRVFHGILIWGIKNTLTMKKMKKYETHPLFRGNRPFAIESIITMKKNFKKFAINSGFCRELPINSQWPPSGHWEFMGKFPPKTTISYTNSCGFLVIHMDFFRIHRYLGNIHVVFFKSTWISSKFTFTIWTWILAINPRGFITLFSLMNPHGFDKIHVDYTKNPHGF